MDDEARLIERLRQGRSTPPPAPQDEWFAVARRVQAPPRRARGWAWGLVGIAAMGLWLCLPGLRPAPTATPLAPAEELRQDLEPLSRGVDVSDDDNSDAPGNEMLTLLDSV